MVKAATLEVEIGAKIDQFERSLGKVRKDLGGMQKRLGGVSRATNKASTAFSGMAKRLVAIGLAYFGTRGIFRMAKSFLDVATSVETYKLRLDAMLGSQQAATEAMNFFKEVAEKVPFTLEEVIEAGVKVQAFGADLKAWTPIMADLAAFMGVKLPEAASALGRAFAGGAGAADVFRERGILQVIKDFARMEKGIDDITKISLPEFRDVMFEAFAGAESKVAGTADKLATTWIGVVSMLQDKWFKFRDAVMKAEVFEILKKGLESFNEGLDVFVETGGLEEWAKNSAISVIEFMKAIVTGIGGVLTVIHGFQAAVFEMASLVTKHLMNQVATLVKVFAVAEKLVPGIKGVTDALADIWLDLKYITEGYTESADKQGETIANVLEKMEALTAGLTKHQEVIEKIKASTGELNVKTEEFGESIVTVAAPAVGEMIKILQAAGVVTKDWSFAVIKSTETQKEMFLSLSRAMTSGIVGVMNVLKQWVMGEFLKALATAKIPFLVKLGMALPTIGLIEAAFSKIKGFQYEGLAIAPTMAMIAEKEPERVIKESRYQDLRKGATEGMPSTVINITQNISAMDALGVRDFMRTRGIAEIVEAVKAGVLKPEFREALGVKT